MKIDPACRFTKEHEWAREEARGVRVGISDYAQIELGDVVFVELPEVGKKVSVGESFANVESVKAVSEIYAPLSGTVVEVNAALSDSPQLVNESPFEKAWMVLIEPSDKSELEGLMDAASYQAYIAEVSK